MTPAELARRVGWAGVDVLEEDGRPVLDGVVPDILEEMARRYKWLFDWGLIGAREYSDKRVECSTSGTRATDVASCNSSTAIETAAAA